MGDKIYTDVEALYNVGRGLVELRENVRPLEQRFMRVIAEYEGEIAETINSLMTEESDMDGLDDDEQRYHMQQRRYDLEDARAAVATYIRAKELFIKHLKLFYSNEDSAASGGLSIVSSSIAALERYLSVDLSIEAITTMDSSNNDVASSHNATGSEKKQDAGGTEIKQNVHKQNINSRSDAAKAVMNDMFAGSNVKISEEKAKGIVDSIRNYTGSMYPLIRNAYTSPEYNAYALKALNNLDEYLKAAPKWEGEIWRGINVSNETAERLLREPYVDMLGPSSWSSDTNVADAFAQGKGDACVLFVLKNNLSGASVTHISSNDHEMEVTAPSGVKYYIDDVLKCNRNGKQYYIVHVHENEVVK